MAPVTDRARETVAAAQNIFTEHELWQLVCLHATLAAERTLVPRDQPRRDHLACRRLAFGLWLSLTGRVSDSAQA